MQKLFKILNFLYFILNKILHIIFPYNAIYTDPENEKYHLFQGQKMMGDDSDSIDLGVTRNMENIPKVNPLNLLDTKRFVQPIDIVSPHPRAFRMGF